MLRKLFPISVSARALFVLLLAALCTTVLFGWLVVHGVAGSQRTGAVGKLAVEIATLPDGMREIAKGRQFGEASGAVPGEKTGFERFAPDAPDTPEAGILMARYSAEVGYYLVELISERSGQVIRRYDPKVPAMGFDLPAFGFEAGITGARAHFRPSHPLLLADGGIVFATGSPLIRVDACGKLLWTVNGLFHHSIEVDGADNFWVPRMLPVPSRKGESFSIAESELVQISPAGKVIQQIPLYQIFVRNEMQHFIDGRPYSIDPYHINDIQPVLESGPFWEKGDLFVSLRNLSMIFLYRPSSGQVIWHREGPWLVQHDVNILDDHRISIFDNHVSMGFGPMKVEGTNRMAIVDFRTGAVSFDYDAAFKQHDIKTVSEGRGTILPGGDLFVEETNFGRLMRVAPDGRLRWRYIHAKPNGTRMMLGWSRFLDPGRFGDAMKNAREAKCQVES
jgi:hypothetical protein